MSTDQAILSRGIAAAETGVKARPRTVFVIDDEPMVGEVVSAVLGLEGYHARLFTSPVDALEAFESAEDKPDLMITDHVMTPFGGLDLIARCRVIVPKLRTILYSGSITDDAIARHETQPDAFLSKPFLPRELIQTVQALLAK
jgi:DNA-binding NtrC family response regulator